MGDASAAFLGGQPLPDLVGGGVPFVIDACNHAVKGVRVYRVEDSGDIGPFLKKSKGLAKLK